MLASESSALITALRAIKFPPRMAGVNERVTYRDVRGCRMACREWGPANGPLVVGIHGLSANSLSFCDVAESLARQGFHVVVPDLRGRNLTPASGKLGWENHARDALALADLFGVREFSIVGHSMGAFTGMRAASLAPARVRALVLVDSLGIPEAAAAAAIGQPTERFERKFASADAYVQWNRNKGHIDPWTNTWDRMYREEVVAIPGGVKPRTDGAAVKTDSQYAVSQCMIPGLFPSQWKSMPDSTLIVRAGTPLAPFFGDIISDTDLMSLAFVKPSARTITVSANHFSAITDPGTVRAVSEFLQERGR
jgi:pimeloyl-ACP methyl ester carboxylesterase